LLSGNNSAATGAVTVSNSGSALVATGTMGATLTTINTGTTLSPGTGAGTLSFSGGLNIKNGSTVLVQGGDLINVGGQLDLDNNWTLTLGTGFQDGGSTLLFDYGTLAAGPDLAPTFDISGLGFTPSGALTLTDTGSAIMLNGISVVPEPGTCALLIGGLGVLGVFTRSRRRFRE
jgi:hypothetical protein